MKKTIFTPYIKQLFHMLPNGDQVYLPFGIFTSRPYIIPDQETKERLSRKHIWLLYICVAFTFGIPVLIFIKGIREFLITPWGFTLFFFGSMALLYRVNWLLIRTDLRNLKRAESRFSMVEFFRTRARNSHIVQLLFANLFFLFFLWVTWSFVDNPERAFIGWFGTIVFGFIEAFFIYMLWLKLTTSKNKIT